MFKEWGRGGLCSFRAKFFHIDFLRSHFQIIAVDRKQSARSVYCNFFQSGLLECWKKFPSLFLRSFLRSFLFPPRRSFLQTPRLRISEDFAVEFRDEDEILELLGSSSWESQFFQFPINPKSQIGKAVS